MKKQLIMALLLVSSTIIAQNNTKEKFKIPKGLWVTGGSVNFYYSNSENENQSSKSKFNTNSFGIKPDVGYSINENLILGIRTGYIISKSENETANFVGKSQVLSASPYIRKHFPLSEKFAFNLQGELMFSNEKHWDRSTDNTTTDPYNTDGNNFFIGLRPGIAYSLTSKIHLHVNLGSLGFNEYKYKQEGLSSKEDSFKFNISTSNLYFGFLIVL